ncbi:MAG: DUF192 domain-containing protein [Candidatus Krumholzibacteria bacterium]|nr:DUF192 domain-containing protein [Candidatus Krumholzibacteria bacterium]
MPVRNRTSGTLLAKTLLTLNAHFHKTLRFLNREGIPDQCALWITPCHAIYTIGMKKPVDIVFLDREGRIVKMLRNFPPNCFANSVHNGISALELPGNCLEKSRTDTGDMLELDPT